MWKVSHNFCYTLLFIINCIQCCYILSSQYKLLLHFLLHQRLITLKYLKCRTKSYDNSILWNPLQCGQLSSNILTHSDIQIFFILLFSFHRYSCYLIFYIHNLYIVHFIWILFTFYLILLYGPIFLFCSSSYCFTIYSTCALIILFLLAS